MKRKGTFLVGLAATVAALVPTVAAAQSPTALNDRVHHGAAVDVKSSIASTRPDDRATHGVGSIGLVQPTTAVRPDDRAGSRGPGAFGGRSDSPTTTVVSSSPNFDWGDASIGALGGLGLALLIGGIAILTTRRTGAGVAHS